MKNQGFTAYLAMCLIGFVAAFLSACSPMRNSQYSSNLVLKNEVSECLKNYSYSSTTSVYGTAKFYKRGINLVTESNKLKNMTLGDPLTTALPIRYAELAVYNSKNQIVQCGVTNATGDLKAVDGSSNLKIPAKADTYIIKVFSRMNQSLSAPVSSPAKPTFKAYIAIKSDTYTNELHSISTSFASDGKTDATNIQMTAYARQTDSLDVEGGAFNILNSIYTAYEYIQNNTGTVNTTCLSDKLNVYWKLGFNPFQYAYPNSDPSYIANGSYYNQDEEHLYITGGRLGEIAMEMTNHFDDYVIIHELGHHIENKCGTLHTPGGNHYIIARIDPRLSWSEGWSNYFAAQVMRSSLSSINPEISAKLTAAGLSSSWQYLFASKGFSDSLQNIGSGDGFMFDLTKPGNNPDSWQYGSLTGITFDKVDPTKYPGEGHFREGAITRGLFKLTNNCGTYCTAATPISFENIWKALDKITGVSASTNSPFKGSHDVLEKVKTFVSSGTWTTNFKTFNEAQTTEALQIFSDGAFTSSGVNRWLPYGTSLSTITSGSCSIGSLYIEPRSDDPVLTSSNSDQRYSNHFYTLDLNLLNNVDELNVTFTKQNSTGTSTEFDILLFQQGYFFNADYYCSQYDSSGNCSTYSTQRLSSSDAIRSDRRAGSFSTKTIKTLSSLDKTKKYLLNIRAYTANKTISSYTDYSYSITDQLGNLICP